MPTEHWGNREKYKWAGGGGDGDTSAPVPEVGRDAHGEMLKNAFERILSEAAKRRSAVGVQIEGAAHGTYIEYESFAGIPLALASMENRRAKDAKKHAKLVAVTESYEREGLEETRVQRATVFIPDGQQDVFRNKLDAYAHEGVEGKRKNTKLYDPVTAINHPSLRSVWTDGFDKFPKDVNHPFWWEVWLQRTDGKEFRRLSAYCEQVGIRAPHREITFYDRIVTLVFATPLELEGALYVMGDIAELCAAKEAAAFFMKSSPVDQAGWVQDLIRRVIPPPSCAPVVCVLDTGVNAGHPLLRDSLDEGDCHALERAWRANDHLGHGTQMAGLALYGDLVPKLDSSADVLLNHRLESVKILPPAGDNPPDLYGAITVEASSRVESKNPKRQRVYSMAVTAPAYGSKGQPTSWSAAVDALAAGRSFDVDRDGLSYFKEDRTRRLYVLSAGNVRDADGNDFLHVDHLATSDRSVVEDPAQAWNAVTVGAYTDKVIIDDEDWKGWNPLAERGELSPWSTTSVPFEPIWPNKPDVVFEGGNAVRDSQELVDSPCDDLCLLTTHYDIQQRTFTTTWATSAATAQAARFCAKIWAEYPDFWPETVRGLLVHSAEWTGAMKKRLERHKTKTPRARLLRRYGYGVPNFEKAIRSARNAVTLISESRIQAFTDGTLSEMHVHELPWPRDVLASLGEEKVRVRVTLSYFIDPNPTRRSWEGRYRYPSHGLRFRIKNHNESIAEFRKRLNKAARDESDKFPVSGETETEWFLGSTARERGSIHSDTFTGTAANISEQGALIVFPTSGWWKNLLKNDRIEDDVRYSLIVSIETDEVDTDIWTPIMSQVRSAVVVST